MWNKHRISAVLVASLSLILMNCEYPVKASLVQAVSEYHHTDCTETPQNRSTLNGTSAITIQFSSEMNPDSLQLGGYLSTYCSEPVWSSDVTENNALTLTPQSRWPAGDYWDLTIEVENHLGYPADPLSLEYSISDGILYVSEVHGDDLNSGSATYPKKTIVNAVATAEDIFDTAEILVAEGRYGPFAITKKIALYGGYSNSSWTERDPEQHVSSISCGYDSISVVDAEQTTVIDGFSINGAQTCISIRNASSLLHGLNIETNNKQDIFGGIIIEDSTVTIQDVSIENDIHAYSVKGIDAEFSQVNIDACTIDCGTVSSDGPVNAAFHGILLVGCRGSISNSLIIGADNAKDSYRYPNIGLFGCNDTLVYNNVIITPNGRLRYGIRCDQYTDCSIYSNTILDSGGQHISGISLSGHSRANIANNLFSLTNGTELVAVSVHEGSFPTSIKNNLLYVTIADAKSGIFQYYDYTVETDRYLYINTEQEFLSEFEQINHFLIPVSDNLLQIDPQLTHYTLSQQTPDSVKTGGLELSDHFSTDFAGNGRTAPWSIGAFEYE